MNSDYEVYRNVKLKSGALYQDFVVDAAWSLLGLAIVQYVSKEYQRTVGESRTGVEIKHDEKYAITGNLWIEIAEKARPRDGDYFPSGIYRSDNTWLYCIGNYDTIFIFSKTLLRALSKSGRYEIRENLTKTSQGFLLNAAEAEKYAAAIIHPNAAKKISKFVGDLASIGREVHEAAKRDPLQLNFLFKFEGDAE